MQSNKKNPEQEEKMLEMLASIFDNSEEEEIEEDSQWADMENDCSLENCEL